MFFRRRRGASTRIGLVAAVFVGYLLAFSPLAATTVYCIGNGGDSGFETVTASQSSCDDCSHDAPAAREQRGALASPGGKCTDVALTTAQDLPRDESGPVVRGTVATVVHDAPSPQSLRATDCSLSQTALSPPRSAPAALRSSTVLRI